MKNLKVKGNRFTGYMFKDIPVHEWSLKDKIIMFFYPMKTQVSVDGILKYKQRKGVTYIYKFDVVVEPPKGE